MSGDIHCAACQGTDYIGRPCRGRTNFREEYDAAIREHDAAKAALDAAIRGRHIALNERDAARGLADEWRKAADAMSDYLVHKGECSCYAGFMCHRCMALGLYDAALAKWGASQ